MSYTDSLRKKLKLHMEVNKCTLYRIEKITGLHRQTVKGFLKGAGLNYENGMSLRTFIKDHMKEDTLKAARLTEEKVVHV